ncbi:hypothetical protein Glove_11g63 [Diversispora epigaea]|uniref:Uncharacterized protein n=1 Tax=Diversispora epigaea TaxID=1348612 RepID=A0A397JN00_9GLOM|nr:hypothetical protein Glove_11g63 [Diversispora epigaea]
MNGLQLISFKEQHLHSMQDYLKALEPILIINNKTNHLQNHIAPIVADWPGQLFLRKALALRSQPNIPQEIEFFLPILGPLHLSLNSRKHIILIYHNFFEQMFHSVFGNNKKLAIDNLIPATLDVYAILFRSGSFEKYIETVFRIWTFALR